MNRANTRRGGYYTVLIKTDDGRQIPYSVFATSDYHAARIVKEETGYLAQSHDVEGPMGMFNF